MPRSHPTRISRESFHLYIRPLLILWGLDSRCRSRKRSSRGAYDSRVIPCPASHTLRAIRPSRAELLAGDCSRFVVQIDMLGRVSYRAFGIRWIVIPSQYCYNALSHHPLVGKSPCTRELHSVQVTYMDCTSSQELYRIYMSNVLVNGMPCK